MKKPKPLSLREVMHRIAAVEKLVDVLVRANLPARADILFKKVEAADERIDEFSAYFRGLEKRIEFIEKKILTCASDAALAGIWRGLDERIKKQAEQYGGYLGPMCERIATLEKAMHGSTITPIVGRTIRGDDGTEMVIQRPPADGPGSHRQDLAELRLLQVKVDEAEKQRDAAIRRADLLSQDLSKASRERDKAQGQEKTLATMNNNQFHMIQDLKKQLAAKDEQVAHYCATLDKIDRFHKEIAP